MAFCVSDHVYDPYVRRTESWLYGNVNVFYFLEHADQSIITRFLILLFGFRCGVQ